MLQPEWETTGRTPKEDRFPDPRQEISDRASQPTVECNHD